MSNRVNIKKGLLGGYQISYDCQHCSAKLKSPLDDAGKTDACPHCGKDFLVPGAIERDRIRSDETAAVEKKRKAKEEQPERDAKRRRDQAIRLADLDAEREASRGREELRAATQTRRCPYCGEEILAAAKKCKHCGEFLTGDKPKPPIVIVQQGESGCSLVLLIALGIVLAVVILAFL